MEPLYLMGPYKAKLLRYSQILDVMKEKLTLGYHNMGNLTLGNPILCIDTIDDHTVGKMSCN